jgi:hypothetical protein
VFSEFDSGLNANHHSRAMRATVPRFMIQYQPFIPIFLNQIIMKTIKIASLLLFALFSFATVFAQSAKQTTIKVWGNCGMCKTKIEKAAKSAGASYASWNEDTKQLKVKYTASKTNPLKIQQAIAAVGYDTEKVKADDAAYDNLHGCCKYDRKGAAEGDAKACCNDEKCSKESCKGKQCCTSADKSCCKHEGKDGAKACCTSDKCSKETCKDKQCCTAADKSCCKTK